MTIQLSHIQKTIGRQTILQDINLSVGQGEVIGLLGPNGAGKSTLMKILVGLWPATSGDAQVCGINMKTNAHDVAPFVGYLPENNPLYEDMYIREFLEFMASISRTKTTHEANLRKLDNPKARVDGVIAMVGLQPEIGKKIGQLSKGFRQRVGLAQALLQDPKLLILDEPTTGLDPNQLEDIRALIRDLGKNRTVILSTHILQEVKQMCSRVVILSHGQIKADMPIDNIDDLEALFREKTYE